MRKPVLEPSVDIYFSQLSQNDKLLVTVLKGHLVIESLLVELIQLRTSSDQPWKWNFAKKIEQCIKEEYITEKQGNALEGFNSIRNDFAHTLGHQPTFETVFKLAQELGEAGFDFSDETIFQDRALSEEWYGIDGVIIDILNTVFFELACKLVDNGGADHCA